MKRIVLCAWKSCAILMTRMMVVKVQILPILYLIIQIRERDLMKKTQVRYGIG